MNAKEVFLFSLLDASGQGWQVLLFIAVRPAPAVPSTSLRVSAVFASFVSGKDREMVSGKGTVRASKGLWEGLLFRQPLAHACQARVSTA